MYRDSKFVTEASFFYKGSRVYCMYMKFLSN